MSAVKEFTESEFNIPRGKRPHEYIKIQNDNCKSTIKKLKLGKVTIEDFIQILDYNLCLYFACRTAIKNESIELDINKTYGIPSGNNSILSSMSIFLNRLLERMFKKFPKFHDDVLKYLDLSLKNEMFYSNYKRTFNEHVFNYYRDPKMYISAAKTVCYNQKANQYIDKCLKLPHECNLLYLNKFSMEYTFMRKSGYHSQEAFDDKMEFHFMLLWRTLQTPNHLKLYNVVFMNIYQEYKCNPYMWQIMAKFNLKGHIFNFDSSSFIYSSHKQCIIKGVIDTYAQGFTQILTKNQQDLRILYIDDLMQIYKSEYMHDKETNKLMQTTLEKFFRDEHVNNAFNCIGYYLDWVKHTKNIGELSRSVNIINEKIQFWASTLKNCIKNNEIRLKMINDAFSYCASSALDSEFSLAYIIQIYMHHHNDPNMLNVLKKHKFNSNLDTILSSKTLEYLELCNGEYADIDEIIEFTNDLKLQHPQFSGLYQNIIDFKKYFNIYKINIVYEFCKLICINGYDNIDLWIDYIQFVYEYCRNAGFLVNKIFQTALNHINPNLCFKMSYKFKKVQKHYVNNTCISLIDD